MAMRFLKMLEKDSMIVLKSETVTTRLTICNYDSYQDMRTDSELQVNRKRTASEPQVNTTKEGKKEKNDKEEEKSFFSVQDSNKIFDSSGLHGNLFAKLCKAYSISKEQILPLYEKWKILRADEIFQDEKHLKNSFAHFVKIESQNLKDAPKQHIRTQKEEEFERNNWF